MGNIRHNRIGRICRLFELLCLCLVPVAIARFRLKKAFVPTATPPSLPMVIRVCPSIRRESGNICAIAAFMSEMIAVPIPSVPTPKVVSFFTMSINRSPSKKPTITPIHGQYKELELGATTIAFG
jgi:hypothetical protein